jgi:hypothetical protein
MHVIYALEDPRDNVVFYVGRTDNLYKRFIQHLQCAEDNHDKNTRIQELKKLGILPIPRTLRQQKASSGRKIARHTGSSTTIICVPCGLWQLRSFRA